MQNDIVLSYGSVMLWYQSACSRNISDRSVIFRYQPGNSVTDEVKKNVDRNVSLDNTSFKSV